MTPKAVMEKTREPGGRAPVCPLIADDFWGFADDFQNFADDFQNLTGDFQNIADDFQNFTGDFQNFMDDIKELRRRAPRSPQGFFLHGGPGS